MRFEIGSEFWEGSTPLDGCGVEKWLPSGMDIIYTLCGRTALELILRDALGGPFIHRAYLPSYCCHTMIEPFIRKGIEVEFYDVVFSESGIQCNFCEENDCEMVLLMDFFGFRDKETDRRASRQRAAGKCVVYDATHALFCQNVDYGAYNYVLGSFRKWFGVNAGFCAKGGAWNYLPALKQSKGYSELRNAAFLEKRRYMQGELTEKEHFLQAFAQAEAQLALDYEEYGPDERSLNILKAINVDFIRRRRTENAAAVIEAVYKIDSLSVDSVFKTVGEDECPLFVPLRVDSGMRAELRQFLIQNQIYYPVHWPLSNLHTLTEKAKGVYETELSFVCDQRYSVSDMMHAIERIRSFCG